MRKNLRSLTVGETFVSQSGGTYTLESMRVTCYRTVIATCSGVDGIGQTVKSLPLALGYADDVVEVI
jgi:hypothetical protein